MVELGAGALTCVLSPVLVHSVGVAPGLSQALTLGGGTGLGVCPVGLGRRSALPAQGSAVSLGSV